MPWVCMWPACRSTSWVRLPTCSTAASAPMGFPFRAYHTEGDAGPACYGVIQFPLGDDQDLTQAHISRIIAVLRREVGANPA